MVDLPTALYRRGFLRERDRSISKNVQDNIYLRVIHSDLRSSVKYLDVAKGTGQPSKSRFEKCDIVALASRNVQ